MISFLLFLNVFRFYGQLDEQKGCSFECFTSFHRLSGIYSQPQERRRMIWVGNKVTVFGGFIFQDAEKLLSSDPSHLFGRCVHRGQRWGNKR